MDRKAAVALIELVLTRLDEQQATWPLTLVREVAVFGSFARGALQPHDVDLLVISDHTDAGWGAHLATCLSYGRDPYSAFRQPLLGRRRGCQMIFDHQDPTELEPITLWRRGDSLEEALNRLRAIRADPSAGRAPRHAMIPAFEGLDDWIPRPDRAALISAIDLGAVTVERIVLDEGSVRSKVALDHIHGRWKSTSPLLRAAHAVIRYWEQQGVDPRRGHLHGKDIRYRDTPYFAAFGLRYLRFMPRYFTEYGGVEYLEVVRPTLTKPLDCLRIMPEDMDETAKLKFW